MSECGAGNSGQSLCETFCDCQISRLLGGADADRVIQSFEGVRSAADIAPEQRARMNVIAAECMPPELYDANFMAACTSSCTDPGCPETCRCFLGKLREGMDPVAGTQWILKNVESDPATAEGEARSSAAAAACGATAAGE